MSYLMYDLNININLYIISIIYKYIIIDIVYDWTGHKAPPHEWVERSYIRDQMTYQVFNNVVVCVRTGPL